MSERPQTRQAEIDEITHIIKLIVGDLIPFSFLYRKHLNGQKVFRPTNDGFYSFQTFEQDRKILIVIDIFTLFSIAIALNEGVARLESGAILSLLVYGLTRYEMHTTRQSAGDYNLIDDERK